MHTNLDSFKLLLTSSFSKADPGFFLGAGALVPCSTSTPINHIVFFFCRIPVGLENHRSSQEGGWRDAHPRNPLPRSAPVFTMTNRLFFGPDEAGVNLLMLV